MLHLNVVILVHFLCCAIQSQTVLSSQKHQPETLQCSLPNNTNIVKLCIRIESAELADFMTHKSDNQPNVLGSLFPCTDTQKLYIIPKSHIASHARSRGDTYGGVYLKALYSFAGKANVDYILGNTPSQRMTLLHCSCWQEFKAPKHATTGGYTNDVLNDERA